MPVPFPLFSFSLSPCLLLSTNSSLHWHGKGQGGPTRCTGCVPHPFLLQHPALCMALPWVLFTQGGSGLLGLVSDGWELLSFVCLSCVGMVCVVLLFLLFACFSRLSSSWRFACLHAPASPCPPPHCPQIFALLLLGLLRPPLGLSPCPLGSGFWSLPMLTCFHTCNFTLLAAAAVAAAIAPRRPRPPQKGIFSDVRKTPPIFSFVFLRKRLNVVVNGVKRSQQNRNVTFRTLRRI